MVVSAKGKGAGESGSGVRQEEDCKETTIELSKSTQTMSKPRRFHYCGTELRRYLFTGGAASGTRGGLSLP